MIHKEIIEKSMKKVLDNGFEKGFKDGYLGQEDSRYFLTWTNGPSVKKFDIATIIFSHDFAKAFWGEKYGNFIVTDMTGKGCNLQDRSWIYHLQNMVVCEDPIKYLEKFL